MKDDIRNIATIGNKLVSDFVIGKCSEFIEQYEASNVAIYSAINSEFDLSGLLQRHPNVTFSLPLTDKKITFIKLSSNDKLTLDKYGVMVPSKGEIIEADAIDLFLIPCLAVNLNGARLGRGKGYYDNYFVDHANAKGIKIGICQDQFNGSYFPDHEKDCRMQYVITEKSVYTYSLVGYDKSS